MRDFSRIMSSNRLGGDGLAAAGRAQGSPISEIWNGDGDLQHPNDLHHGTESDDTLNGLGGNDTLYGEGGNDHLYGQTSNDVLIGGDGDDSIYDTDGKDFADGGDGADDITLGNVNGSDRVVAYGRAGNDVMTLRGIVKAYGGQGDDYVSIARAAVVAGEFRGDGGDNDTLLIGEQVVFHGNFEARLQGFENVSATHSFSGDDFKNLLNFSGTGYVLAYPQGLSINAGAGDDTIIGSQRSDLLHGEGDKDRLFGWLGNDTLYGDSGNDELQGQDGDDAIHADDGDFAVGGDGDDVIFASGVSDVGGGAGLDTVDLTGWRGVLEDQISGGTGQDTLVVEINTEFAMDRFDLADASFERLAPQAPIYGDFGKNVLLFAHARLVDGYVGATFYGADGDDKIQGLNASNDQIHGDDGVDTLYGMSGDDTLWSGLGGLDVLDGGIGNDKLFAEAGNETLKGGDGDDLLDMTGVQAPDLAPAEAFGGRGDDVVRISDTVMAPPVRSGAAQAQVIIDGGQGRDTLVIGSNFEVDTDLFAPKAWGFEVLTAAASFTCGASANTVDLHGLAVAGGLGGAWISGNNGDDVLIGTGGMDRLIGGAGNDDLRGAGGADSIFGSDGDDTVDGGSGNDSLSGETGVDLLTYASATGAVTVSLAISGAQDTGGGGTDTLATFENLTGSRFGDHLTGNSADNRITGGRGDDTLAGGGGADTFVLTSVAESTRASPDLIADLSDADRIDVHGVTPSFHLVASFSHAAGEATLRFDAASALTTLLIDVNGDGRADSEMLMTGDHSGFTGFVT